MCDVCDEESLGVSFVGGDADGSTAACWIDSGVVDAEVDGVVGVACEGTGVGINLISEFDEATGGIGSVEEGELVEEVGRVVGILDSV